CKAMGHRQVWTIWQNLQLRAGANADTELSARVPISLAQLPVFQGFFSFFHEIAKKVKGLPLLNDGNTKQFVSAAVEDGRTGTIKKPGKAGFQRYQLLLGTTTDSSKSSSMSFPLGH